MRYYDMQEQLKVLAELDESQDYEVDYTLIGINEAGRFVLVTASGCSCWDGDCDTEEFDSLDALEISLGLGEAEEKDRRWNPSWKGGKELMKEAREALTKQ